MKSLMSIIITLTILGIVGVKMGSAAPSAAKCKQERRVWVNACKPVINGNMPSPDCCKRMRLTHIQCFCPVITPKLAALVDLNRALRIVQGCGRRVPRHFKCGSITTP